ncbi:MAG: hypothetical protein JOZ41_05040 [Chloroflexi bacterium]|nr:hypothetical protein [Chloroflexota bacterium]
MARESDHSSSFFVPDTQALIGVAIRQHGREVTRFFADEAEADRELTQQATDQALQLAGCWSDLPWEELEDGLERIRDESSSSPPIAV